MNIYDIVFRDGTTDRRTLVFMGVVPQKIDLKKRLEEITGRKDIAKITRALSGAVVWQEQN